MHYGQPPAGKQAGAGGAGQYEIGFLGWIADYPVIDNFVYSLFCCTSQDNRLFYKNPGVDEALQEARKVTDDERVKAYQAIVRTIGENSPLVPVFVARHCCLASDRVRDLVFSSLYWASFESCWLAGDK